MTRDNHQATLLGLALSDMRWTDDTQMALDIADCIIANGRIVRNGLTPTIADEWSLVPWWKPWIAA